MIIKRLSRFALILLLFGSFSCQKDTTDISLLLGKWSEYYNDPLFISDTDNTFTITSDSILMHSYDMLSGEQEDWSVEYRIDGKRITLYYPKGYYNTSSETFDIVLLTNEEMAWQKAGTTFSKNSYGGDYRHFVNEKYWKTHPPVLQ